MATKPIDEMTANPNPTGGAPPEDPLARARQDMRDRQAYWASAMGAVCSPTQDTLDRALKAIAEWRSSQVRDGEFIRQGEFKFKADLEAARWAITANIIQRVVPGPCEDPRYAVILARQAASVEWALQNVSRDPGAPSLNEPLARVLLGTTGEPRSEAYSTLVDATAIVLVSAGMIDFMYQTSKAVVLSWKVEEAKGSSHAFSARPDDTEETLKANPYPANLFYDTLSSWFYEGRPRASYAEAPPRAYRGPLSILISGAERFVIAHEYGHALAHLLGVPNVSPAQSTGVPRSWIREIQADGFANLMVIQSSGALDLLPANIALQGAVLAMKAHQIFESAVQIATTGKPSEETGSQTHPPFGDRIHILEEAYVQSHADPDAARRDLAGMTFPAETVDQLWKRVAPRLGADFRAGRRLHPVWSMPGL